MSDRIKSVVLAASGIALLFASTQGIAAESEPEVAAYEPSDAFMQVAGLKGKWQGKLMRSTGKIVDLTLGYKVVGNGSAVVESIQEGDLEMVSVYHDRDDELMVTHYCALQNQPVLQLSERTETAVSFVHDPSRGLKEGVDAFVNSLKLVNDPKKPTELQFIYTVTFPDGTMWTHQGRLNKVG